MKVPRCQLADEGPVRPPLTVCMVSVSYKELFVSERGQDFQSDVGCGTTVVIIQSQNSAFGQQQALHLPYLVTV